MEIGSSEAKKGGLFFKREKFLARISIPPSDARAPLLNVHPVHLFRVARTNATVAATTRYPADKDEAVRRDRRAASARQTEYPADHFSARVAFTLSPLGTTTAKKEVKQTRGGRREEEGRGRRGRRGSESEGHRRWLSETPRPHDQCHGAFIVLQQKGAHQSTGISSRLISRGHPLVLSGLLPLSPPHGLSQPQSLRRPFFPPFAAPLSLAFCSEAPRPPLSLFRPSAPPRRRPSPTFFGRAVGRSARGARAAGRPAGGGRQIAGRRSAAVVMKTYEIYSIWADAITPSADRGGGQPPVNPRGYTGRCVCARVCMHVRAYVCVYTRCGTSSS